MSGMWLSSNTFKYIVKYAPLVSIDLIVENKNGKFLLGKRKNPPAKGFFFVPGGRILKGEKLSNAFRRITINELGKSFNLREARFLGVYEHFYEDSFADNAISTHYIVLAFWIRCTSNLLLPKEQHDEYLWLSSQEIITRKDIHEYAKEYFRLTLLNSRYKNLVPSFPEGG